MPKTLVLASTSPFRRMLLEKLHLPFVCAAPNTNETRRINEPHAALVARLAFEKAQAVQAQFPDALIIGSDQIAVAKDDILLKPGNYDNARKQLQACSGNRVVFFTGLCLLDAEHGDHQSAVETFTVHFRALSERQIHHYLRKEEPYNCAGSFKSEGLGIVLIDRLEGDDPNTLIGLPLIRLTRMLEGKGVNPI